MRKLIAFVLFGRFRCDMCGAKLKPSKETVRRNQYLSYVLAALVFIITAIYSRSVSTWLMAAAVIVITLLVTLIFNLLSISNCKFEVKE